MFSLHLYQWTDQQDRKLIRKHVLNDTLDEQTSLISSGHSIQMQTTTSQVHMEHSPGETTSWVTNQTSVNSRKLKSFPTTML